MPELPEVETVVRGLNQYLVGHTILSFDFDWPKTIKTPIKVIQKELVGSKVLGARRRAKLIIIDLGSGYSILIHLKMTGQVVYRSPRVNYGAGHPNDSLVSKLPDKSTRVEMKLDGEAELFFNDQRKFGWLELVPTAEHHLHRFISTLGPEPLEISFKDFKSILKKYPKSQIKAKLLDQKIIAGIGNIYVDESLWAVRIHPATKIGDISDKKLKELFVALVDLLNLSISLGGSSSKNYVKVDGKVGSYLTFANVYKKEGEPCKRCGTDIARIVVAGRGTRICPKCQKL